MVPTVGLLRDLMKLVLLDLPRIEPTEGLVRDLQEDTGSIVILHVVVMSGALETMDVILLRVIATMIVTAVVSIGNDPPKDVMAIIVLDKMKCLPSNSKSG